MNTLSEINEETVDEKRTVDESTQLSKSNRVAPDFVQIAIIAKRAGK